MEIRNGLVDFHLHSKYSDGSEDIISLIKEAKGRGVTALALTDHNTGRGMGEFVETCKMADIKPLEGAEIFLRFPVAEWSQNPNFCGVAPDAVILGRKLDWRIFEGYQKMLMEYWATIWLPATLEKLEKAGLEMPYSFSEKDKLRQLENFAVPRVLHDVLLLIENRAPLFELVQKEEPTVLLEDVLASPVRWGNKYLYAYGRPAYVERVFLGWSVARAVELAEKMGGLLFAAHPGGQFANWGPKHLEYFIEQGGHGIEVWQYWHTEEQIRYFLEFALQHQLVVSGGSDWHGANGRPTLGCWDKPEVRTPEWVLAHLLDNLP